MHIQVSSLILVLSCSVCSAAVAEDAVAKDTRTPGDSVIKEASRTIYGTKGLKSEPKNLQQYQPVTEYLGVEIETLKRPRRSASRGDRGSAGDDENRRRTRDKTEPAE